MFYDGWKDGFQGESMQKPITVLYEYDKKAEAVLIAKMLYDHHIPYEIREREDSNTKGAHLILAGGFGDYSLCTFEDLFIYNYEEVKEILRNQKQGELLISEKPLQKQVDFALIHRLYEIIEQQAIIHDEYREERYPYYSPNTDPSDDFPYDDDDDRDVAYAEMLRAEKGCGCNLNSSHNAHLDEQLKRVGNILGGLCKIYESACSAKPK